MGVIRLQSQAKGIRFIRISDASVLAIWECQECKKQIPIVPSWYQDNGTPVCTACDIDMKYKYTMIAKES